MNTMRFTDKEIYSGDENKDKDTKYLYTVMLSLK
jgi:hypothetical protein